jgi:hypothetical protein
MAAPIYTETSTAGYYVLAIITSQICCLLKCGGRITPIAPESDRVKRFATLKDAWETCDEIMADGMAPYFVRAEGGAA